MEVSKSYDYRQIEKSIKRGGRFLILNADDMGMSRGVTDGIVKTYTDGLTTDVSMIASMPDSGRAARLALDCGMNVGVHLDLTHQKREKIVGRPLLGDAVPSLTDEEGYFFGSGEFRQRMLSGGIAMGEVEAELRRQVEQALEWGLDLTHIDSNEGLHNYYPEILKIVLNIARERDIPIRWPNPVHLDWLRADTILTSDYLNYTFYDVRPDAKKRTFLRLLDDLAAGVTEFIFHPAVAEPETKELTVWERREAEMLLLTDPDVARELSERKIQPISFRELREKQRDMRRRGVGTLRAGSAKVKITPPFPTQMGGYFDRKDLSRGAHDDLFVRAMYLDDGSRSTLLISVEILYVDAELVADVRTEVSRLTPMSPESIMVFATHTHSGPEGHTKLSSLLGFFPNPTLRKFLVERIACCAVMAVNGARDARFGASSVEVTDMSSNRQKDGGPTDQALRAILVEDKMGVTVGALVNFGAHPVIMDSKNLLYCSEYPGHAMKILEESLGEDAACLFANGACGNVTIRRSGPAFSEVERVGRLLAGHALRALAGTETSEEVRICSASSSISLPLRKFPSVADARREIERLGATEARSPAEMQSRKRKLAKATGTAALAAKAEQIRALLGDELTTQIQTIHINDNLVAGIPAELFVEYGLSIIEELAPNRTFLVGYCNDIVGYVVTPEAADEGGYEAGATFLSPEAGGRIVQGLVKMANG